MRKVHSTIAALAVVTIAFAACEQQGGEDTGAAEDEVAATDTADVEAQLDAFRTDFEAAWNARDWDAIVVMHSEDYQEVTPEGDVLGYGDIETAMQDTAMAPPEDARLSIDTETMEIAESGDIAYGTGTTTLTATGPDGQEMTQTERWMAGFENVDGEWKLDRLVRSVVAAPDTDEAAPMDEPAGEDTEETDTTM